MVMKNVEPVVAELNAPVNPRAETGDAKTVLPGAVPSDNHGPAVGPEPPVTRTMALVIIAGPLAPVAFVQSR